MCKIPSLLQQEKVKNAVEQNVCEDLTELAHDYLIAYNDSENNPADYPLKRSKARFNRKTRAKLRELGIAYH